MLKRKSSRARVLLRRIAVTAVILAVGAAWAWLAIPSAGPQSSDAGSDSPSLMTVEVRRAQKIDVWESKARCSGLVRAKRKSDLGFERSGRVERVLVEQGERVDKDAVLATLNAELPQAQLRKLKADLQAAEAVLAEMISGPRKEVIEAARAGVQQLDVQLTLARQAFERRSRLAGSEAISKEDIEQSETSLRKTEAARVQAQKNLEDLELGTRSEKIDMQRAMVASLKESIAAAAVEVDRCVLRAPYAGSIVERTIHEGMVVQNGSRAFVICEDQSLEAQFGIPPSRITSLKIGDPVSLEIRKQSVSGTVKSMNSLIDDDTRTLRVVVEIASGSSTSVYPGDIAFLETSDSESVEGFRLSTEAVTQGRKGLWECFVVEDADDSHAGRVASRSIEILRSEGNEICVRGTLRPDDLVIVDAIDRIVAGQRVQVRDVEAGQ